MKPKNKGHMNIYECCVLTKKVYLTLHTTTYILYLFSKTRATAFLFCSFIEKSRALSLKLFVESPFSLSQKLGSVKSSVSFSFSGEFSFFLLFSCILIHTTQQYFKKELYNLKTKNEVCRIFMRILMPLAIIIQKKKNLGEFAGKTVRHS